MTASSYLPHVITLSDFKSTASRKNVDLIMWVLTN